MKTNLAKIICSLLLTLTFASFLHNPAEADTVQTNQERAALANQQAGFLAIAPDLLQRSLRDYERSEFRAVKLGSYSFPLRRPFSWSFIICGERRPSGAQENDWQKFAITGGTGLRPEVIEFDALEIEALCVSNLEGAAWLPADLSAEVSPATYDKQTSTPR